MRSGTTASGSGAGTTSATAPRRNFERDVGVGGRSVAANEGDLADGYEYDAAIVSGSGASVYGDEPWITPLLERVDGAIGRDLPVLGVCFGHKLLAHALGGEVRDVGEYELGYREIGRVGESELLSGPPPSGFSRSRPAPTR